MNLPFNIVQLSKNIIVNFKERLVRKDLSKYSIMKYEYWNFRQNPSTKTIGYVLFVNYKGTYKVNFNWYLVYLQY